MPDSADSGEVAERVARHAERPGFRSATFLVLQGMGSYDSVPVT